LFECFKNNSIENHGYIYIYEDGVFDFSRTMIMNLKNRFDNREALFLLFCFFLIIAQQQQQHNGLSPPPSRFPKKGSKKEVGR